MPRLTIPPANRDAFEKLAAFEDETVDRLVSALAAEVATLSMRDVIEHASEHVADVDSDLIASVLNAVAFLILAGTDLSMSLSDLAEEAAASPVLKLSDEQRGLLRAALERILRCEPLVVSAKALGVAVEHPRVYVSARAVSDIRAIFLDRPTEEPVAAIITHSLKISYYANGRTEDFFVSMDSTDVEELRKVLDRAAEKGQRLRAVVQRSGLGYLDATRE